ncbi:MAG: RNA polymerase-binding protein DksA [Desulforhopalus sp.]|nr:RNA polymerase-binding protein DksA [Desulforhopalus sp.]
MIAERIKFFRKQLLTTRDEMLLEANKTLNEMTETSNVPDPNDRATLESGRSFELRIRDREQKLVKKIDEAISRIDDGTFGICEACGEEIGLKRLEARPVTTLCINCKTSQETLEKATGQ